MTPGELLAHFFDLRGDSDSDTARFSDFRHNNDLCPRFQKNVDALLSTYSSYYADAQDIQGMSDEGVDVLLRYVDRNGSRMRAGIQVKSHKEFEDWMKKSERGGGSMVEKLLAQYGRAKNNAKINDYYIVLCTNEEVHRDWIRQITAAFKNFEDVKVITPKKALAFFEMSDDEVSLNVTRILCADDPLLKGAQNQMTTLGYAKAYMLLHLTCYALSSSSRADDNLLLSLFEDCSPLQDEHDVTVDPYLLGNILSFFEDSNIIEREDGGSEIFTINISNLPASLCAIYFDQKYRNNHDSKDMAEYLCNLLEIDALV
jgi:hypothetical protein